MDTSLSDKTLGNWKIIRQLGRGCLGDVYLAQHVDSGHKCVVKVFPRELSDDPSFADRFNTVAQSLKLFDHPGIVKTFHYGCDEGLCYLVIEYVWGPSGEPLTLEKYLQEHGGKLPEGEITEYTRQLSSALQYAHCREPSDGSTGQYSCFPHGNLKPANILLDRNMKAVITDFGLVDMVGGAGLEKLAQDPERSRLWLNSRYYFSPERINGEPVTPLSDIFSLGIIIYQMITGKVPFGPYKRPSEARADINRNWDKVVDGCLQPNPDDRLPEAGQIPELLESKNGNKGFWKLAVAALLAVCIGVGVFLYLQGRDDDETGVQQGESGAAATEQQDKSVSAEGVRQAPGSSEKTLAEKTITQETTTQEPAAVPSPGVDKSLPPGKIKISSVPSEARIFLDGREFGLTPYQSRDNEIKAGTEHVLVLKKSGYADKIIRFSIQNRLLHDLGVVKLEIAQGQLSVLSNPSGADVYLLDGRFLGKTPIEKVLLDIGEYTVLLRKNDFEDLKVDVKIEEEKETRVEEILTAGIEMAVRVLLQEASRRMAQKQYLKPSGESALDIYREILHVDKNNSQARGGIEKIYQYYLLKGDAMLTTGELERARTCFRQCVDILPDDSRAKIKLIKIQEKELTAAQEKTSSKAASRAAAPKAKQNQLDSVWNTFSGSTPNFNSNKSKDGKSYVQIELDMTCGGAFELGFQETYVIFVDGVEKLRCHDMPAQKDIHFTTPRVQVEPGGHRIELWYYVKEGILGNINRKAQIFSADVEKGTIMNLYLKKDVHD